MAVLESFAKDVDARPGATGRLLPNERSEHNERRGARQRSLGLARQNHYMEGHHGCA